jgi:hypothetical protein
MLPGFFIALILSTLSRLEELLCMVLLVFVNNYPVHVTISVFSLYRHKLYDKCQTKFRFKEIDQRIDERFAQIHAKAILLVLID